MLQGKQAIDFQEVIGPGLDVEILIQVDPKLEAAIRARLEAMLPGPAEHGPRLKIYFLGANPEHLWRFARWANEDNKVILRQGRMIFSDYFVTEPQELNLTGNDYRLGMALGNLNLIYKQLIPRSKTASSTFLGDYARTLRFYLTMPWGKFKAEDEQLLRELWAKFLNVDYTKLEAVNLQKVRHEFQQILASPTLRARLQTLAKAPRGSLGELIFQIYQNLIQQKVLPGPRDFGYDALRPVWATEQTLVDLAGQMYQASLYELPALFTTYQNLRKAVQQQAGTAAPLGGKISQEKLRKLFTPQILAHLQELANLAAEQDRQEPLPIDPRDVLLSSSPSLWKVLAPASVASFLSDASFRKKIQQAFFELSVYEVQAFWPLLLANLPLPLLTQYLDTRLARLADIMANGHRPEFAKDKFKEIDREKVGPTIIEILRKQGYLGDQVKETQQVLRAMIEQAMHHPGIPAQHFGDWSKLVRELQKADTLVDWGDNRQFLKDFAPLSSTLPRNKPRAQICRQPLVKN